MPAAFVACACIISVWCFSLASLGSSSGQRLLCILCLRIWFMGCSTDLVLGLLRRKM